MPSRCVLKQDTSFLKCLYPARFMNECRAADKHPKEAGIRGVGGGGGEGE